MGKTREHIYYLDYLRLFGAVSVVYMHTAAPGLRAGITRGWHFMNLATSLAFTAVPIFFMISGYLLLSDPNTLRPEVLLRRRLPRLVIPLAVWTTATALWNCYEAGWTLSLREQLNDALHAPIVTPLWFMYYLIFVYLLTPLLYGGVHMLDRDGVRYVLGIVAVLSLGAMVRAFLPERLDRYASLEVLARLQSSLSYVFLFLLGYFLGNWKRKVPNLLLAAVAAAAYAVIVLGTWWLSAKNGSYDTSFQDQSAGFEVLLAACLFLLAKQNLNRDALWMRRVAAAPLLMPVYLMHALQLKIFYFHEVHPMRFPQIVGYTLLNLLLCLLISKTAASIKPLCYPLTGMPYQAACRSCNWQYTWHLCHKGNPE